MIPIIHENNKSQQVTINKNAISIVEYKGQPVLTFKMIDELHERPDGTASRIFRDRCDKFKEREHFYKLSSDEIRRMSESGIFPKRTARAMLITERGYLKIVKSLTDDLAEEIYESVLDVYFKAKPKLPQSMAQALRLAADQAEEIEKLEAQNQKMLPVVERHKALTSATGLMKFSEAAKAIRNTGVDTGQNRFTKWLRENGYLFKSCNEPKQVYIEQGLFKTKATNYKHPHTGEVIVTMQTYVTPKGVDYFAKEMKELET